MDPQEITEELEHPGARNLLDSATLLRLAYNGSDGLPRVIAIGFYWNGSRSSSARQKRDPAACHYGLDPTLCSQPFPACHRRTKPNGG